MRRKWFYDIDIKPAEPVRKHPEETDLKFLMRELNEAKETAAFFPAAVCLLPGGIGGGAIVYTPNPTKPEVILSFGREDEGEPLDIVYMKSQRARRFKKAYEKLYGSIAKEDFTGNDVEKVLRMLLSFYKSEGGAA